MKIAGGVNCDQAVTEDWILCTLILKDPIMEATSPYRVSLTVPADGVISTASRDAERVCPIEFRTVVFSPNTGASVSLAIACI